MREPISKNRSLFTIGALAAATIMLLAIACAGDDDETTTPQMQQQPAAAEQPSAAAAAADPSAPEAAIGTTTTTSTGDTMMKPQASSAAAQAQFDAFPEDGMPQYGGILRLSAGEFNTLSSLDNASPSTTTVHQMTMDHLLRWDWFGDYRGSKKPATGVSKSWDVSGDGTTWTFQLRDDVKFHDGSPFTCADVKATYDFLVNPGEYGPPAASYVKPFVETTACPDPHTVVLNLVAPAPALLLNLAYSWVTIFNGEILEREGPEYFETHVEGTGPFIWQEDEYEPGIRYETARNPNYWDEGLPYLDGVRSFIIGDAGAALAAFETKRIDTGAGTPDQQADLIGRYGDEMNLVKYPSGSHAYILWNVRKPPFDDPKVRRAMYLWMDRAPFLAKANDGRGFTRDWINPNWNGGFGTSYEDLVKNNPAYNPDKTEARKMALELLDEAGWSDRGSVKIDVMSRYTRGNSLEGNQILHSQLKEMGWDAELRTLETLGGLQALRAGDYQAAYYGGSAGLPSADATLNRYLAPTGQRNYTGVSDLIFEKLIAEYNSEIDPQKRADKLSEIDQHLQQGTYSMHVMVWGATEGLQWNYLHGFDWLKGGWERSHYHVWLGPDAPGRS